MRALALLPALLLAGACAGRPLVVDPGSGRVVAPAASGWGRPLGAVVRVRFDTARSVPLARGAGPVAHDTVPGVRALVGRLRASRSDTLWLSVSSVTSAGGTIAYPLEASRVWTTRVQREPGLQIDLVARNPGRLETVAGGVIIGGVGIALGVAAYCLTRRCGG